MLDHLAPTIVPILLILAFLCANLHNFEIELFSKLIMLPLVISIKTTAITRGTLVSQSRAADDFYLSLMMSFFSLSLAENTIVTGLIVAKILIIYRNISPSNVGCTSKLGRDIVPILIESDNIWCNLCRP